MSKVTISCKNCKKKVERYKSLIRNVENSFCGNKCKSEDQKKSLVGKNNPNYRHGDYADIQYCSCGNVKDHRSIECAECAHRGYLKNGLAPKWRSIELAHIVKESKSFREVGDKIKVSRITAKNLIHESKIDISHFRVARGRPDPTEKYLVKGNIKRYATIKKIILERDILKYICDECNQGPIWNGKELILELHHINGDPCDNRVENLKFVCPHCHSQTKTYKGKNSKCKKKK